MNNLNGSPFVSTPFSSEFENPHLMPALIPPGATVSPGTPRMEDMDSLYPEIYRELYPLITDMVNRMIAEGYTLTPDSISAIVDNIIKNSGLWYEDDDDRFDMSPEVVPLQFGRMPYRRRRRRHHNRDSLRDIIRILLLQELFGRQNRFPYHNY